MTDKEIIIDGKIIGCPCYIDRPLHRYDKGCLVQSQAFKEQQTEEKPILRCDEIKNCPIKENFKQLQCKTAECEKQKEKWNIGFQKFCDKDNELQHYKQALDEIEKICKKSSKEWETYKNETCIFHCKTRETDKAKLADKILGVINKAKEKE